MSDENTNGYSIGETVALHDDAGRRDFTITGIHEAGGGSPLTVYEAEYVDESGIRHHGLLEECRRDAGSEAARKWAAPYRDLRRLIRSDKDEDYSFLPPFAVCSAPDGRAQVWIERTNSTTFATICDGWLLNEQETVVETLYSIIATVHDLTACIATLHASGLAHGGLTDTSFGFRTKPDGQPDTRVALFGLGALSAVSKRSAEDPGKKRDVRDIGLVMCKALGVSDESLEGILKAPSVDDIASSIRNADVFDLKGLPADGGVLSELSELLADMLGGPASHGIPACTDAAGRLSELEDRLTVLMPFPQERLKRGYGIMVVDREAQRQDRVRAIFQYLLNDRPLYRWQDDASPEYNVLLLGFGLDSQRFLDVCLETAQSMDQRIVVDVWDTRGIRKERDGYLKARPALGQFFLVDGMEDRLSGAPYGVINFHAAPAERLDAASDGQLEELAKTHCDARYVYIAVGKDDENAGIARRLSRLFDGRSVSINAQCEDRTPDADGIHYVWVNSNVEENENYAELDRMSLNAHLTWTPSLNADLGQAIASYRKDYYHSSSLSYVLSIQYKLHYLGIELSEGADEAARALRSIQLDDAKRTVMGLAEHRRWVTGMLCEGWRSMTVEESLPCNGTKDTAGRRHVCIVRSDDRPRPTDWNDHRKWDALDDTAFLDQLDDLDRMSVMLHRAYLSYAEKYGYDYSTAERTMQDIAGEIANDASLSWIFSEWCSNLREIYDAALKQGRDALSTAVTRLSVHERLYGRLRQAVTADRGLDRLGKESITGKLDSIHASFAPIVRCLEYHDYKKNDTDLIDGIPFILTYSTDLAMVVPANYEVLSSSRSNKREGMQGKDMGAPLESKGRVWYQNSNARFPNLDQLFSYVAAATIVNPRTLYVPYISRKNADVGQENARRAWEGCIRDYAQAKGLQSEIKFIPLRERQGLEEILRQAGGAQPTGKVLVEGNDNLSKVIDLPTGRAFGHPVIEYAFDAISMRFSGDDAMWLNDIHRPDAGLTVQDVVTFLGREAKVKDQPSFGGIDVSLLFGTYRDNRGYWKETCFLLKDPYHYEENRRTGGNPQPQRYAELMRFKKTGRPQWKRQMAPATATRFYFLPHACYDSAEIILGLLKDKRIIGERSYLLPYSADACKVVIFEYREGEYRRELDALFAMQYLLAMEQDYRIMDEDDCFVLEHNALEFKSIPFDFHRRLPDGTLDKRAEGVYRILQRLHAQGLIRFTENDDKTFDIIYGSRQIKDLLMVEGRILEVYVYYKCRELAGEFDDVASDIVFYPTNSEDKPVEVDCLVTRGFQTLMVECKARSYTTPEEESIYDSEKRALYKNMKRLCINGSAILVVENDTAAVPAAVERPGVEVCTDHRQIGDIGNTILHRFTQREQGR